MANFSNFPNMGHCAIENTVKSMRQVLEGFDEANTIEEFDLNQYEERAYNEMYELCEALMSEMQRFEYNKGKDFDEAYDEELEEEY